MPDESEVLAKDGPINVGSYEYESEEYSEEYDEESDEIPRDYPINVGTLSQVNTTKTASRQYSPLVCGINDTLHYGEFAVIETPNYANYGRYPNNHDCSWTIQIPASSEILFWCEYFHVRRGDYLFIQDQAYYGYASEGFQFDPITSPDVTSTLNLRFRTNRRGRGYGFRQSIDSF